MAASAELPPASFTFILKRDFLVTNWQEMHQPLSRHPPQSTQPPAWQESAAGERAPEGRTRGEKGSATEAGETLQRCPGNRKSSELAHEGCYLSEDHCPVPAVHFLLLPSWKGHSPPIGHELQHRYPSFQGTLSFSTYQRMVCMHTGLRKFSPYSRWITAARSGPLQQGQRAAITPDYPRDTTGESLEEIINL